MRPVRMVSREPQALKGLLARRASLEPQARLVRRVRLARTASRDRLDLKAPPVLTGLLALPVLRVQRDLVVTRARLDLVVTRARRAPPELTGSRAQQAPLVRRVLLARKVQLGKTALPALPVRMVLLVLIALRDQLAPRDLVVTRARPVRRVPLGPRVLMGSQALQVRRAHKDLLA